MSVSQIDRKICKWFDPNFIFDSKSKILNILPPPLSVSIPLNVSSHFPGSEFHHSLTAQQIVILVFNIGTTFGIANIPECAVIII